MEKILLLMVLCQLLNFVLPAKFDIEHCTFYESKPSVWQVRHAAKDAKTCMEACEIEHDCILWNMVTSGCRLFTTRSTPSKSDSFGYNHCNGFKPSGDAPYCPLILEKNKSPAMKNKVVAKVSSTEDCRKECSKFGYCIIWQFNENSKECRLGVLIPFPSTKGEKNGSFSSSYCKKANPECTDAKIGQIGILAATKGEFSLFHNFTEKYCKSYSSIKEFMLRRSIYEKNIEVIANHNAEYDAGKHTWYMKENQDTDLTDEEFLKMKTGGVLIPEGVSDPIDPSSNRVPGKGCPAADVVFMTTATIDSCLMIEAEKKHVCLNKQNNQKNVYNNMLPRENQLSQQMYISLCADQGRYKAQGYNCTGGGCTGSAYLDGYYPLKQNDHFGKIYCFQCWSYYAYVDANGLDRLKRSNDGCFKKYPKSCNDQEHYNGDYDYSIGTDEDAMYSRLLKNPVGTALEVTEKFRHYGGGIFIDEGCAVNNKGKINHAVVVVGYGTNCLGQDYWLIKNCWGKGWGEHGFMKIKRGIGECQIGYVQVIPKNCWITN